MCKSSYNAPLPDPMGYVSGFDHDVFVSYAHGDDRDLINGLKPLRDADINRPARNLSPCVISLDV
jgi:hypothetical protein